MVQFCKPFLQVIVGMSLRMTLALCRQTRLKHAVAALCKYTKKCTQESEIWQQYQHPQSAKPSNVNKIRSALATLCCLPVACRFHTDPSGTFVTYEAKAIGSGSEGAQSSLQVSIRSCPVSRDSETLHARGLPMLLACAFESVCNGVMHICTVACATLAVCPRCISV